jgi:hypothetical protein
MSAGIDHVDHDASAAGPLSVAAVPDERPRDRERFQAAFQVAFAELADVQDLGGRRLDVLLSPSVEVEVPFEQDR